MPPHETLYQDNEAPGPEPSEPPICVSVTDVPGQIVVADALIEVGAIFKVFTVTVVVTHVVVLHIPSALAKYDVVIVGKTVILVPVPAMVPPHEAVYHLQDAPVPRLPPTTLKTVESPLHIVVVPEIEEAGVEGVFAVTVTCKQAVLPHVPSALTK